MTTSEELMAALEAAGRERHAARARALEASTRIRALVRNALDLGMTKSEIARLAQVSRQALDEMLTDR